MTSPARASRFLGALLVLLSLSPALAEEPWSVSPEAPVVAPPPPRAGAVSWMARPFDWALVLFQVLVSPGDGPRCGMFPTCSAYARGAVRKHGPLLGTFMAADRLMRDNGDARGYPLIERYGRLRLFDPVEANDFWWSGPR